MFSESGPGEFQEVENRLKANAPQFSRVVPPPELVSTIVEEHARRRCRVLVCRSAVMATVGCLLLVGLTFVIEPLRRFQTTRLSAPASPAKIVQQPVAVTPNEQRGTGEGRNLLTHSSRSADEALGLPVAADSSVATVSPPETYVPVLIVVTDTEGQPVTVPGIYVPARIESVRLEDLSPPLRRAARMVLGIEETSIGKDPI